MTCVVQRQRQYGSSLTLALKPPRQPLARRVPIDSLLHAADERSTGCQADDFAGCPIDQLKRGRAVKFGHQVNSRRVRFTAASIHVNGQFLLLPLRHLQGVDDVGIVPQFDIERFGLWSRNVDRLARKALRDLDAVGKGRIGCDGIN